MDAVEFFKTVNRLCKNQRCEECPVYKNNTCCMVGFDDDSIKNIEETVSKVERWAKDHPVKTRQSEFLKSEFLKMFPNAAIDDGILCIRPCEIDESIVCTNEKGCKNCCRNYWLAEVTDNE